MSLHYFDNFFWRNKCLRVCVCERARERFGSLLAIMTILFHLIQNG